MVRKDNASIAKINNKPNIIDIIPIIILTADKCVNMFHTENPLAIEAKPKNNKLNPTIMDIACALKIGKIIKIKPSMTNKIPKICLKSI